MIPQARAYLTRLRAASSGATDLTRTADWIIANTRHPRVASQHWSFKDHEFQIGICNEHRYKASIRKCSQIGLSELSVRIMLALLAIYPSTTGIYTLPSAGFARKFAKSRIDPVISASPDLKPMVPTEINSSELKRIGTSFLHISGTWGQAAAISVPADVLIHDEVDFSNQTVLTTYASRLGHAQDGGIVRRFSTPTVNGYGVSEAYDNGTQASYAIKCPGCYEWVVPNFLLDVVLPGYDGALVELDKSDVGNPLYKFDEAKLLCPECRAEIPHDRLADPARRQWVHAYPDRDEASYQVAPIDAPAVNSVTKTLTAIKDYDRKADWVNFELGIPYEDAESTFLPDVMKANRVVEWLAPRPMAAQGCIAGLDLGKTSWMLIGHTRDGRTIDLVHAEKIKETGEGYLVERVMELVKWYGIIKLVVDAMPNFSTGLQLINRTRHNQTYACYYVRSNRTALSNMDVKDVEQVINANRTGTFDDLVKAVNAGQYRFARHQEFNLVIEHLASMKRVSHMNSQGERVAAWTATGDDHYAHALNYLELARQMCDYSGKHPIIATLPSVSKARVGGANENGGDNPHIYGV